MKHYIATELPDLQHATILAGDRYREFLTPRLLARGVQVDVPMQGLRIGEQLRWLDRQMRSYSSSSK
ncbi:MAG TPA: hypothetical protein PLB31_02165 [Fimbriimonadaceae bacterium]|nr:hypothetical protein [Fimbriimonadaceae bacterium]HRE94872.1 hypothetical protein [Fimbriimonadaceae bacterium]HRI73255.1 hypothetical protein [Fimbriimonadaceae bacterium]